MKNLTVMVALLGFSFSSLAMQSPLTFEAASIKPFKPVVGGFAGSGCRGWDNPSFRSTGPLQIGLGRCRCVGASFVGLVKDAFGATHVYGDAQENLSVSGVKTWMGYDGDQFVIDAKAADGTQWTSELLLQMMRNLIVERFRLKFHYETKDVQGYNLVVAKDGPKWTALSDSDPRAPGFGGRGELTGQTDPTRLARQISGALGVPISDRTGLSDRFAVNLKWSPQNLDRDPTNPDAGFAGPTIFTVLQQELGLQLVPAKISVKVFVIDSAERPVMR